MIRLAIKHAKNSVENFRHGAVIAHGNRVISSGVNSYKTHPTYGVGTLKTLHAEAQAIKRAVSSGMNLRGATIYVARTGHVSRMSKPCAGCQALIKKHGIAKIVYTDTNGEIITIWPL